MPSAAEIAEAESRVTEAPSPPESPAADQLGFFGEPGS
jgi:hypothetical protein